MLTKILEAYKAGEIGLQEAEDRINNPLVFVDHRKPRKRVAKSAKRPIQEATEEQAKPQLTGDQIREDHDICSQVLDSLLSRHSRKNLAQFLADMVQRGNRESVYIGIGRWKSGEVPHSYYADALAELYVR